MEDRPLRIQMITDRYAPAIGGAERQLELLASTLKKSGHNISIVTRHLQSGLPTHEVLKGVAVTRLRPTGLSKFANALIIPRLVIYLLFQHSQYDLIHCQSLGPVGIASIISGCIARKPVILRVATAGDISREEVGKTLSFYTRFIRQYVVSPTLWRAFINAASSVVVLSEELADEARLSAITAPITIIPNGVDITDYQPAADDEINELRSHLNLPHKTPILFTSGRLVARKRIDILINAMPAILKHYPECLLLIAGDGAQQTDSVEAALRQQVDELGLRQSVIFLGMIHNIIDYLKSSNLFVFPSENEGMPNALLEAMACGLPSVACDIGGVRDLTTKETTILVSPGDVKSLSVAILRLLGDRELAHGMGEKAHEHIQEHFAIESVARRYEKLYWQVIHP